MVGSRAKWFKGEVTRHSKESGLYNVVYEDGDEEECNIEELKTILVTGT